MIHSSLSMMHFALSTFYILLVLTCVTQADVHLSKRELPYDIANFKSFDHRTTTATTKPLDHPSHLPSLPAMLIKDDHRIMITDPHRIATAVMIRTANIPSSSSAVPSSSSMLSHASANSSSVVHATSTTVVVATNVSHPPANGSAPVLNNGKEHPTAIKSGPSSGAIAGIIAGLCIAIAGLAAFIIMRRKKAAARCHNSRIRRQSDPFTMGFGSHEPAPYRNTVVYPEMSYATTHNSYNPFESPRDADERSVPSGSLGVGIVVSTYTPTLHDEISIQRGDRVELLAEYDDGWCQGINLTRGNAKGVFPKHCVNFAST